MGARRLLTGALTLAMTTATMSGIVAGGGAAAADTVVRDGTTPQRAAASCWEVKQVNPAAVSGVYWLQTPKLITPQQFYCDQVTDGGGWVLVGRGREGWSWDNIGQSSASAVRNPVAGMSAFAPAALSRATVDGLLDGASPDTLADGVRVRRASNATGTAFQELRYFVAPGQGGWSWAFGGSIKLSSVSQDLDAEGPLANRNYPGTGLTTRDWTPAGKNDATRVWTFESSAHNFKAGFSYGATVTGTSSSTSYLWQYAAEKQAVPFAQVWLRPQLRDLAFTAPDTAGAPEQTLTPLMQNKTVSMPWGVTGVVGNGTGETNIEVQAVTPVGDTVYVGGKFQYVQKGKTPAAGEKVEQSYVAAFDVNTGEWKSAFRPKLDGQVWDIQALPSGQIVLGGEFATVNGVASRGLVAVDPVTGAVSTTWKAVLSAGTVASTKARALDVQGNWLYVGGTFNSVTGGVAKPATAKLGNATRVKVTDGTPDLAWKPNFAGTVMELDASDRGDQVYFVGHFIADGVSTHLQATGLAVVTATAPAVLVPGMKPYQPSSPNVVKQYQQIIREFGDDVWSGGSEHILQRYDRSTYDLKKSFLMRSGGDLQTATKIGNVIYAGCHCDGYAYTDGSQYVGNLNTPPTYTRADSINWIGAWDATTGDYLPDFALPGLKSRAGNGPWELAEDVNGCLWFGGDFNLGTNSQWLGGFGKACPRDTVAPSAPTGVTVQRNTNGTVDVRWSASTDNAAGTVSYEVIRNDREVLQSPWTGLAYNDKDAPAGTTYWVRAIDAAGNRSASAAAVVAP